MTTESLRGRRPEAHLRAPAAVSRVSLETRKVLLAHKNGDITSHYSIAEIGELLATADKVCAVKGTPAVTMLRSAAA